MAIWKDIVAKDSNQPEAAAGAAAAGQSAAPEVVPNTPAPLPRR